jgi:cell division protein FtsW
MRQKIKNLDYWLVVPYAILSAIGIVMVFSASSNMMSGSAMSYLLRQTVFVGIGWVAAFVILQLNINQLRQLITAKIVMWGMVGVLAFAFTMPAINGAHGWIPLPGFSIQPVEFFKLFVILYLADYLTKHPWQPGRGVLQQTIFRDTNTILPIIIALGIVFFYPDVGNLFITLVIILVLLMVSGLGRRWTLILTSGALLGLAILPRVIDALNLDGTSHYALSRLTAFVNPWDNPDAGHQLIIAYYAIAHGGLFGVGLGNSILKQGYLPEPNTDFIMAIMTEELGAFLTFIVLLLEFILILRMMLLGIRQAQQFYRLLLFGLATFLFVQIMVNFGGVLGLLPITGVTFPFISYGGSSFLVLSLAMGLALNVAHHRQKVGGGQ